MTEDLDMDYPDVMPFYLYGTEDSLHIDHVLLKIPNIHLSAGRISHAFDPPLSAADLAEGVVVVANNVHEASMQPFPIMKYMVIDDNFFFNVGKKMSVTVYRDPYPASTMDPVHMDAFKEVITTGEITLQGNLYIDTDALNDASEAEKEIPVLRTVTGKMREDHVEGWKRSLAAMNGQMV
jgi:hypothetical protein